MNIDDFGYRLTYEYQICFDDGGVGHDCFWQKSTIPLWGAKNDKEAIAKAKEILKPGSACNGAWCDNKGQKRFIKLVLRNTVIQERVVPLS